MAAKATVVRVVLAMAEAMTVVAAGVVTVMGAVVRAAVVAVAAATGLGAMVAAMDAVAIAPGVLATAAQMEGPRTRGNAAGKAAVGPTLPAAPAAAGTPRGSHPASHRAAGRPR